jgi:hypothetical protein
MLPRVPSEEDRHFVPIAADRHGTPAAAMGARIIVKEEPAGRIRATANGCLGAFDEKLCGRASYGGQQPIESAFASNKLQGPGTFLRDQFIMSFSDPQDFIDRLDPGRWDRPLLHNRRENRAQGFAQANDAQKDGIDGLWLGVEQRKKAASTILGDQPGVHQKSNKFLPGEIAGSGSEIGEVECETAGNELRRKRRHITGRSP